MVCTAEAQGLRAPSFTHLAELYGDLAALRRTENRKMTALRMTENRDLAA